MYQEWVPCSVRNVPLYYGAQADWRDTGEVLRRERKNMAKCTAPIYGQRTESGRLNCSSPGRLGGRMFYNLTNGYTPYSSYYSRIISEN